MNYENKNNLENKFKSQNENDFVDKLISFKGFLKILLFFSIQVLILTIQLSNVFQDVYLTDQNIWQYNYQVLFAILGNYVAFLAILVFIFAFNLGKELKTRKKEKFIYFLFKFFIITPIFLITNSFIIFYSINYYINAKLNYMFEVYAQEIFVNRTMILIFYIWLLVIASYLFVRFLLFITNSLTRNKQNDRILNSSYANTNYSNQYSMEPPSQLQTQDQRIPSTPQMQVQYQSQVHVPSKTQVNVQKNVITNDSKTLTKKEIIESQMKDTKELQQNHNLLNDVKQEFNEPLSEKEIKPKTPESIITFLDRNLLHLPLIEQAIIFFTLTELFFLSLFTFETYSKFVNYSSDKNQYYLVGSLLVNYALLEVIFYIIIALFYFDILKNHYKHPQNESLKYSIALILIGFSIITIFTDIGYTYFADYVTIFGFILIKYFILLLVPVFYFGYKNQNESKSEVNKITKVNPVFNYLYNKSINELRENEKSYGIVKKYLQLHKEDIKRSLTQATPLNFRENIRTVILNDYDRLETLLTYNGIKIKSKVAVIDFTMEVFSTFLINIEVNLQDIYTEHLLKSSPENIHKIIGTEFIESRFLKLFSQWESLEISS